jgi:hypothetical protein
MKFSISHLLPLSLTRKSIFTVGAAIAAALLGSVALPANADDIASLSVSFTPIGISGGGDSNTLGGIFCNAYTNLALFTNFYDYIAYTIGAYLIALGIYGLSRSIEAPGQNARHSQILRIAAGSMMLTLPSVVGTLISTVFVGGGAGGSTYCSSGGAISSGAQTLDVMLENAVGNIQGPFLSLMSIMAIVIGLYFIIHGLYTGARHGYDPRTHSTTKIVSNLLVGTLLVAVGDSFDAVTDAIFGTTGVTVPVTSWTMVSNLTNNGVAQGHIQSAIMAALTVVQMVGIIAFIRGLIIMKKAAEGSGQATMPQGLTHIIGGVLAINIYQFLEAVQWTFGTDFF